MTKRTRKSLYSTLSRTAPNVSLRFSQLQHPLLSVLPLFEFFSEKCCSSISSPSSSSSDLLYSPRNSDWTACFSPNPSPGSRYTCSTTPSSCRTFTVYRSWQGFNNVSEIAGLFNVEVVQVLSLNNLTNSSQILEENREVLLPIKCSCAGGFFLSEITYAAPSNTTYADISCNIFEGLVKLSSLSEANSIDLNIIKKGMMLKVPLKCGCPDVNDTGNGFQYLVTYPIQESDEPKLIAEKFSIPLGDLLAKNSLGRHNCVSYHYSSCSPEKCIGNQLAYLRSSHVEVLPRYMVEELSKAKKGFSKATRLGSSVYMGTIGCSEFAIKKMGFGDARRTISIQSKINNANIVKLEGVCYGDGLFHGTRVTQIAFDVTVGLHYIHPCTTPSYINMNITSRNILITENWRAKIANLGEGYAINSSREWGRNISMTSEGWIAPEYLHYGFVSAKVDVFAFGVVLFELLSAKEVRDMSILTERLCFLCGGRGVTDCFDELRVFLDPNLKDYPIGDAFCTTVLAKVCVEEDSTNRPSMNDILKILARMVR